MDQATNPQPQAAQVAGPATPAPEAAPAENQDTNSANPLEQYAQNLLIERGAMGIEPELVAGMKADIMDRLELLTTQVMLMALNEADAVEFERMVDNGATAAQLQDFAAAKIPDLSQRITEALIRFRQAYLGSAA
ncbi:MAG: hypothetical protein WCI47_00715 [bacterium]